MRILCHWTIPLPEINSHPEKMALQSWKLNQLITSLEVPDVCPLSLGRARLWLCALILFGEIVAKEALSLGTSCSGPCCDLEAKYNLVRRRCRKTTENGTLCWLTPNFSHCLGQATAQWRGSLLPNRILIIIYCLHLNWISLPNVSRVDLRYTTSLVFALKIG